MQKLMIYALLLFSIASCRKEEISRTKDGPAVLPIFPLKKGNSWKIVSTSYDENGKVRRSYTWLDTIKESRIINGKEFLGFGADYYRLVDDYMLEIAGDRSGKGWEQSYIYYHYANRLDTLWKTETYIDIYIGDSLYCIAHPGDTIINGLKCRKTEMLGFGYEGDNTYPIFKQVLYFAQGKGPVYEERYYLNSSTNHKFMDIVYTPLLIQID